ncbi:MAG: DUF4118 domain-containing protein [Cytophagales bacterium]|nr:DUF4118 domain-containing protein [Cytophagales bacterium]
MLNIFWANKFRFEPSGFYKIFIHQLTTFVNGFSQSKPIPDQLWPGTGNCLGVLLLSRIDRLQGCSAYPDGNGVYSGHGVGYFSSIGSCVAQCPYLEFLFIPPTFTFQIRTPEDALMFLMYFLIASINAVLTYKIRDFEKKARDRERKHYKTI